MARYRIQRRRAVVWWLMMSFVLLVGASGTARATQKVDLNAATMAELMTLPNIGQKRAEEIVRYRLTHGFKRPADLLRIKGIGRRTYFKLKPLVRVGPLPASRAREIEAAPAEAP
jgi:competence ComEA-like helix-hairpin-helix protein